LDACPASAITPDDDYISVDTGICGGCGTCSAVCPSGAVSYAYPRREDLIRRAQTLVSTYLKAGGTDPVLLIHDQIHGAEMISAMARFGRGLPAGALPLAINSVTQIGHDLLAATLAAGAARIFILCPPDRRDEMAPLTTQGELIEALLSGLGFEDANRVHLLDAQDPDIIETALWDCDTLPLAPQAKKAAIETGSVFEPIGGKRAVARAAFSKLHALAPGKSDIIELPEHAPYGRVVIDTEGCTLCLSCVSCCPADALHDNPDKPQVSFVESACLQCGLCTATCPENVMTLEPRFNFLPGALSPEILYEDEPADCVRCGKPFGSKGTIERISAQLAGKHSMFLSGERAEMIRMCDDCRVIVQTQTSPDPMAQGTIPAPRTTEEYLDAEKILRGKINGKDTSAQRLKAQDFLKDDT
ncbi:MAG: 4Fe-4S binding protein, partial [Fimbriimonadaceae bacterium]|nr:4Fe-4S binding protein [Alphaproteobacteria bacterium]